MRKSSILVSKLAGFSKVQIFRLDLDADSSAAAVAFDTLLSQSELRRADKFVYPIHRQRYVRGRTWVRQTLSSFLDIAPKQIVLDKLEFGKPVLKDPALYFNLSHANQHAVLAVSETCHVGIDIESYERNVEVDALRRTHYTQLENDWLDQLSPAQLRAGFFKLWTAKEARMKVTGEGFSLPPERIEVRCVDLEPIRYLYPQEPRVWLTNLPELGADLSCTLATSAPITEVSYCR